MKAQDVMVRDVLTVGPDTSVAEAVALLIKHDISALPVVNSVGNLIGILSEADLLEREEVGAEHHHPWWIESLDAGQQAGGTVRQGPWQEGLGGDVDRFDHCA